MGQGPCSGLTVLDLTWGIAGPLATLLLSDNGARVIKVEPPWGDPFRQLPGYPVWCRGKESLALDLKAEEGRAVLTALAQVADVLVESYAPGVTERLGIDHAALAPLNPRLVYCSITGWGDRGPWRDKPAYDVLVAARSNIMGAQPGFRPGPVFMAHPIPSLGAALLAAQGITVALYVREATGRGQRVETSLLAGALAMQASEFVFSEKLTAPLARGVRSPFGSQPFYSIHQCQDGQWLHLGCINPGFVWKAVQALDLEEVVLEPRFGDGRNFRSEEDRQAMMDIVREKIASKPYAAWVAIFDAHDVPYAPVGTTEAFMDDPQVRFNEMVTALEDPLLGQMEQMGLPLKFHRTPGQVQGPAPLLGQHTAAILQDLGYSSARIGQLQEKGVITG